MPIKHSYGSESRRTDREVRIFALAENIFVNRAKALLWLRSPGDRSNPKVVK
jgi:uncharacterized protein (DUF2384 family)